LSATVWVVPCGVLTRTPIAALLASVIRGLLRRCAISCALGLQGHRATAVASARDPLRRWVPWRPGRDAMLTNMQRSRTEGEADEVQP
jgi:hypothetical protein